MKKHLVSLGSGALLLGLAAATAVAAPASATASAGGSPVTGHVYVNDNTAGTNTIGAFDRHADGTLTPEPGSPFPAGGAGTGAGLASQGAIQFAAGGRFVPTHPSQLFVSNAHNTAADSGTVSAFNDHRNGRLSSIGGSPFPDHQMAPCWVEITPDGQFLFTVNTASGSVSSYRIAANGALTLLGSTPISGTKIGAVDARLSPDGGFLYVDESAVGKVAAFTVSGGSLAELGTSPVPLPAGAAAAGIVVS
jgi:DNA-binding beta-propeller fold protein YncE